MPDCLDWVACIGGLYVSACPPVCMVEPGWLLMILKTDTVHLGGSAALNLGCGSSARPTLPTGAAYSCPPEVGDYTCTTVCTTGYTAANSSRLNVTCSNGVWAPSIGSITCNPAGKFRDVTSSAELAWLRCLVGMHNLQVEESSAEPACRHHSRVLHILSEHSKCAMC